ncbi:MAG TPA: hypothetical protein V6D06_18985, partial [Trichocoleus sp.]
TVLKRFRERAGVYFFQLDSSKTLTMARLIPVRELVANPRQPEHLGEALAPAVDSVGLDAKNLAPPASYKRWLH